MDENPKKKKSAAEHKEFRLRFFYDVGGKFPLHGEGRGWHMTNWGQLLVIRMTEGGGHKDDVSYTWGGGRV